MPIVYTREEGWTIKDATPEELLVLTEVGKVMIINGLAGAYVNDKFKKHLMFVPKDSYFNG